MIRGNKKQYGDALWLMMVDDWYELVANGQLAKGDTIMGNNNQGPANYVAMLHTNNVQLATWVFLKLGDP